jgi:hypothetical protein
MPELIVISIVLAAVFLVMFGCATGMLFLAGKTSGWRLLLLTPVPGAVAIGICTAIYLLSYAGDYFAVALFAGVFMLAAWLLGVVFCLIAAAIRQARGMQ